MFGWPNSQPWFWVWVIARPVRELAFPHHELLPCANSPELPGLNSPNARASVLRSSDADEDTHTTRASSTVLSRQGAWPSLTVAVEGMRGKGSALLLPHSQGWLYILTTASALADCTGRAQGPLSCLLQLMRGQRSSLS